MNIAHFYQNKRVLITGHTGFKGSWLACWLHALGAHVSGIALEADKQYHRLFHFLDAESWLTHSIYDDISSSSQLVPLIAESKAEIVFHLAAEPLVRRSYQSPEMTYQTNVMGTVALLEAVRQSETVKTLVNVTTDKCYENKEWVWPYRETDPLGGHDPYSASKACSEIVTASYRQSFLKEKNITVATARAGNVIGGGDYGQDRLIPDLLRAHEAGEALKIRFPQAIRPWQHVLDVLYGYMLLGQYLHETQDHGLESVNFAPHYVTPLTVKQLVSRIAEQLGFAHVIEYEASDLHEAQFLALDASKARAMLGWSAMLSEQEMTRLTAESYLAIDRDVKNTRAHIEQQISHYMQLKEKAE